MKIKEIEEIKIKITPTSTSNDVVDTEVYFENSQDHKYPKRPMIANPKAAINKALLIVLICVLLYVLFCIIWFSIYIYYMTYSHLNHKVIFHIDINAFFASCEIIKNKNLKDKIFVVAGKTKRSVVSCASYKARALGINAAMPIFNALKICPNLIVVKHNMELYESISNIFFNYIKENISNIIEIGSIDECFIDVTHLINKTNTPYKLAQKIQNEIYKKLSLKVSIGVSYNKILAKMASDFKKPMGITEIFTKKDIEEKIWPQPISNMFMVGKSTLKIFNSLNINTIGEFIEYKNHEYLKQKIGKHIAYLYENFVSEGDNFVNNEKNDIKSISVSRTFLENTSNFDEIKTYIKSLTNELLSRISFNEIIPGTIVLQIKTINGKLHSKNEKITTNNFSIEMFIYLFTKLYERSFKNILIKNLSLGFSNLKYFNKNNENLFSKKINVKDDINSIKNKINKEFKYDVLVLGTKLKIKD